MASYLPPNSAFDSDEESHDISDVRRSGHDSVNVFSDEFAEDYAESVHTLTAENPFLDTATLLEGNSYGDHGETIRFEETYHPRTRDSTRKSGTGEDSAYLGTRRIGGIDGQAGGAERESLGLKSSTRSTRSLSVTSSASFAPSRASTVLPNSSGPSHAYGAYPQGFGVDRSESIASTSTGRPSRGSIRRGPLHLYGLYPQNAGESLGTESSAPSVGPPSFISGRRQRLGYQDSIRSSAPSEQLPAYTQYADDLHTKIAAGPPLTPTSHRSMASQMEEERSPFTPQIFELNEDDSTAANTRANRSQPDHVYTEKEQEDGKKASWLKGSVCGFVPRWTLLLGICVVALIAAICGGVIGAVLGRQNKVTLGHLVHNSTESATSAYALPDHTSYALVITETTTQYIDATPIATPSSMSALPTGTFQVNIDMPAIIANSSLCLSDPAQRVAWSCDMDTSTTLDLQIIQQAQGSFLTVNFGTIAQISYGTQPPALVGSLALVNLLGNASLGPAFQFQTDYDKLVILPGDASINVSYSASYKRDVPDFDWMPALSGRQIAHDDNPWFCWFNDTSIEGFVFVNRTALPPPPSSVTAQPSQAAVSISGVSSTLAVSATTTLSATLSSTIPFVSASGWPSHPQYYTPPTTVATWPAATYAATQRPSTTSCDTTGDPGVYGEGQWVDPEVVRRQQSSASTEPPGLPMLFRLEERRGPGAAPAVCTKMAKVDSGRYAPMLYNGAVQVVYLNESDAQYSSISSRSPLQERAAKSCYCLWET